MADLLLYAAIKAQKDVVDKELGFISPKVDFTGDVTPASTPYPVIEDATYPSIATLWQEQLDEFIGDPQPNVACIWNADGYFICGINCNWCVQAGVTRVTMEMWGPGGSTSSNCCCGGAPFGPNGAYMALKFDVTPGECLCICAGCAYCCYATQTTPGLIGGHTWFKTDTNLGSTLGQIAACADSGISCYSYWYESAKAAGLSVMAGNTCTIPIGFGDADNCAAAQCSGWNFCWDADGDDVDIPPIFSNYTKSYLTCSDGSTGRNLQVFKIPGTYPCMYIPSPNLTGAKTSNAPVPRYENCICTITFNGSSCFGCQLGGIGLGGSGYRCGVPGAGGSGNWVAGGCNACGGDSGRLGLVRLSWTCN